MLMKDDGSVRGSEVPVDKLFILADVLWVGSSAPGWSVVTSINCVVSHFLLEYTLSGVLLECCSTWSHIYLLAPPVVQFI
jgi:hypothetical protein